MPTLAEMFPLPDGAKTLERFIGDWTFDGTLTIEGNALPMTGEWSFTGVAGGWGVRGAMTSEVEGLGSYEEDDLVGFDQETGKVHIYSVTNSAAVHDHVGEWSDENTLQAEYDGLQGGKPYHEAIRVRFTASDVIEMESQDYVEGELASAIVVTLRKR
jgi:hypothetical protein